MSEFLEKLSEVNKELLLAESVQFNLNTRPNEKRYRLQVPDTLHLHPLLHIAPNENTCRLEIGSKSENVT